MKINLFYYERDTLSASIQGGYYVRYGESARKPLFPDFRKIRVYRSRMQMAVVSRVCQKRAPSTAQRQMGIMRLAAYPQNRAHLPCCPVVHRQAGKRRVSQ